MKTKKSFRINCYFLLITFLTLSNSLIIAQSSIQLSNPSFEDTPGAAKKPTGWYDCGFPSETPPDVQPCNAFNVTKKANNGNTYLGLVTRDNDTWEGVAQRLVSPILKGVCYKFSIDLARSEAYRSPSRITQQMTDFVQPVKIRIWGGNEYCERDELLSESDAITSTEWRKYDLQFTSKKDYRFFFIEAYYKTPSLFPYNGNILIDNCSKINPCNVTNIQNQPVPIVPQQNSSTKTTTQPTKPISTQPNIASKPSSSNSTNNPSKSETRPGTGTSETKPDIPVVTKERLKNQPVLKYNPELDINKLKEGQAIKVNKLLFTANSYEIDQASLPVLDEIYEFLVANPNVTVEIGGHTNGLPPHEFCDELSRNRAFEVRKYLLKKGLNTDRIAAKGYGKRRPIATNETRQGRDQNQRVEIKILSL